MNPAPATLSPWSGTGGAPPRSRRLFASTLAIVVVAVWIAGVAGAAEEEGKERKAFTLPGAEGEKTLELTAGSGSVFGKDELLLKEYVDIRYGDLRLQADAVRYVPTTKQVTAEGNVILDSGSTRLTAARVEYNLETGKGTFYQARGYAEPSFYFEAAEVEKIDADRYLITDATFTTCTQPVPYWSFKVSRGTIHLDNYAYLHNVSFRVEKVPAFYSPYLVWPIKEDRASGLLFPEFGFSRRRGFVLSNALYWVIRRNMDATFFLDYYALAGVGEGLEYRYVPSRNGKGQLTASFIRDQVTDRDRYFVNLNHRQDLPDDFRLVASFNDVSDFDYFLDFQRDLRLSTNPVILSNLYLTKNWSYYAFNLRAERREQIFSVSRSLFSTATLRARTETEEEELTNLIEPRIEFRGSRQRLGASPLYFAFETSVDSFEKQTTLFSTTYQRFDLFPTFSAPLRLTSWLDINPTVGFRNTYYTRTIQVDSEGRPVKLSEDGDGDGFPDRNEDTGLDGIPGTGDFGEGNGLLDTEDTNQNRVLDPGEDLNGNGKLDTEDSDGDGVLGLVDEDTGLDGTAGTGDFGEGNGILDQRQLISDGDFNRKFYQGSVEIIGPKFSRIFQRPDSRFSPLYKNTIEPRVFYLYQSRVDNPERVIPFDEKDSITGNQNSVQYSLTTRLFAKRPGVSAPAGPPSTGLSLSQSLSGPPEEGTSLSSPPQPAVEEKASLSPIEIASFQIAQAYSFLGPLSRKGDCVLEDDRLVTPPSVGGLSFEPCVISNLSPVDLILRYNPTLHASLDLKTRYDILFNTIRSGSLSANFRSPTRGFVDLTWFFQNALEAFAPDSNQLGLLAETNVWNRKLVLGFQGNYDVVARELRDQRYKIGYNTQCCGFTFEILDRSYLGISQQEFRLLINLKGIGNVLDINSGSSAIPTIPIGF